MYMHMKWASHMTALLFVVDVAVQCRFFTSTNCTYAQKVGILGAGLYLLLLGKWKI